MQNLLVVLATAEPSPGEDLREGLDPEMVTPGTLGFLATLFVVIATVFLIRDMAKRVRRVRYREQVQRQADDQDADDGGTSGDEPGGNPGFSEDNRDDDGGRPGDSRVAGREATGGGPDDAVAGSTGDTRTGDTRTPGKADGTASELKNSNGAGSDRKR